MDLASAVTSAYNKKWSMNNTYSVQFVLPPHLESKVGVFEDINLHIVSITTPDFANDPIEVYVANKWVLQNGREAMYRYSITFRDHNQMSLYQKFLMIYKESLNNYFDDVAMTVLISKDADWYGESSKPLLYFAGSMIEAVSNLSISNVDASQVAEFTVSFKCNEPITTEPDK